MKSQNLLQQSGMSQTARQQKGKYKEGTSIKFETATIKSSLCDYSDAFILVTGNITVDANNDTDVVFKNCAPFSTCTTKINDVLFDEANHIYIAMPMYNLIKYSDNYSDTSGSLLQFKRDEVPANNANLIIDDSQSFSLFNVERRTFLNIINQTESAILDKVSYFSLLSYFIAMNLSKIS